MSSKRRLRRNACSGKQKFLSFAEAGRTAHIIHVRTGDRVGPYKCPFGRHYHVGHTPRKVTALLYELRS